MIHNNPRLIVVDVREQSEYCSITASPPGHIAGARLYPWNSGALRDRYEDLPADGDILVYCGMSIRSPQAADFLCTHGFTSVYNMAPGFTAWEGPSVGCCFSDADCDDGLFCTGDESCVALNCRPGSGDPCAGTPYYRCDDDADACVMCPEDYDCDGVSDPADNCMRTPNGPDRGTCVRIMSDLLLAHRDSCEIDADCEPTYFCMKNQEDNNGDGVGDVCECEADFDSDLDVDGRNAAQFKTDFGRNRLCNPCSPPASPCHGDFACDGDVDGVDVLKFKEDFGRSVLNNPCFAGSSVSCE